MLTSELKTHVENDATVTGKKLKNATMGNRWKDEISRKIVNIFRPYNGIDVLKLPFLEELYEKIFVVPYVIYRKGAILSSHSDCSLNETFSFYVVQCDECCIQHSMKR